MPSEIALADERNVDDPSAEAHERNVEEELKAQFIELRRQARGQFDVVKGRRGAYSEAYWEEAFSKARVNYESGRFLIRRLGAERHLDLELVAVLTQLRQELMYGIESPTAADKMLADTAVLAYRNLLRIQGWIGSLCLVMERELFGQEPVSEANGATVGERIEREMYQLEQSLMPLLDRAHRMLVRSLDRLVARRGIECQSQLSIGHATQVNVASSVRNNGG